MSMSQLFWNRTKHSFSNIHLSKKKKKGNKNHLPTSPLMCKHIDLSWRVSLLFYIYSFHPSTEQSAFKNQSVHILSADIDPSLHCK